MRSYEYNVCRSGKNNIFFEIKHYTQITFMWKALNNMNITKKRSIIRQDKFLK